MDREPLVPTAASNSSAFSHHLSEFEKAVHENRPRIYRFLLASSHDPDLAEVLTQECFLKAFQHWSSFRGDAQVSTWLMKIAINLQKSHWRNRRTQFWHQACASTVEADDILRQVPDERESPERSAIAKQQMTLVWNIISGLPRRQRRVYLLRAVGELKVKEIADMTGIPEGTVKTYLHRSVKSIRKALWQETPRQNLLI